MMQKGLNELLLGYFFYGLSYVFLGALLIFQPRREERRDLSDSLWFLGLFGVLHGLDEWIEMIIQARSWSPGIDTWLRVASGATNTLALLSLMQFAVNLLVRPRSTLAWLRRVPLVVFSTWLVLLSLGAALGSHASALAVSEASLRYGLGFAAAVLACYALLTFQPADLSPSVRKLLLCSTVFFGINAFLSVTTASQASFADLYGVGNGVSGLPLTLVIFRAVCTMLVAVTIVYALMRLDLEQNQLLLRQRDELILAHERLTESFQELQDTQQQLVQSEKMSAVATLVSGIAHEYNNILSGVKGFTQLARMGDDLEQVHRDLEVVEQSADRAIEITRNLQSWVRPEKRPRESVEVNTVVQQAIALVEGTLARGNVTVQTRLGEIPPLLVSKAELQDVILNLLINASHAIDKEKQGLIRVSTAVRGTFAVLEVVDNGCGIPAENLGRIFLPFFTTKGALGTSQTRGTGLGLYVVYGIVQARGGDVRVESEPGVGTTFRIFLPIPDPQQVQGVTGAPSWEGEAVEVPENLRVLVVDDEPAVRTAATRFLEKGASLVVAATSGDEALQVARGQPFDLVLLDLTMPGLSGMDTLEALKKEHPHLPVLLMTGRLDLDIREQALQRGAANLVRKPFDFQELVETVRRAAGGRPNPEAVALEGEPA